MTFNLFYPGFCWYEFITVSHAMSRVASKKGLHSVQNLVQNVRGTNECTNLCVMEKSMHATIMLQQSKFLPWQHRIRPWVEGQWDTCLSRNGCKTASNQDSLGTLAATLVFTAFRLRETEKHLGSEGIFSSYERGKYIQNIPKHSGYVSLESKNMPNCSFREKCFHFYINTLWTFLLCENVPFSNKTFSPHIYVLFLPSYNSPDSSHTAH